MTLKTFSHNQFSLRAIQIEGRPWFHSKDVCTALGLTGYPANHLSSLNKTDKRVLDRKTPVDGQLPDPILFAGGVPSVTMLNLSGLRQLVHGSRQATAPAFRQWLNDEVFSALSEPSSDQPKADTGTAPATVEGITRAVLAASQNVAQELAELAPKIQQAEQELEGLKTMQALLRMELGKLAQVAAILAGDQQQEAQGPAPIGEVEQAKATEPSQAAPAGALTTATLADNLPPWEA